MVCVFMCIENLGMDTINGWGEEPDFRNAVRRKAFHWIIVLQPGSFAMCPSYSKNRQHVLKTNNLLGVPLTQPFPSMQPGSDSLARSWTRLLSSRELCSPCWQSPTWAHGFLLFTLVSCPLPPGWVGSSYREFSASTGPWDLCTGCSSPWNTLSSPSVTHSHSSFHLQGSWSLHHHPWPK